MLLQLRAFDASKPPYVWDFWLYEARDKTNKHKNKSFCFF